MKTVDFIYDIIWFVVGMFLMIMIMLLFGIDTVGEEARYNMQSGIDDMREQQLASAFAAGNLSDTELVRSEALTYYYSIEDGDEFELGGDTLCRSCSSGISLKDKIISDLDKYQEFKRADWQVTTVPHIPGIRENGGFGKPVPVPAADGSVVDVRMRIEDTVLEKFDAVIEVDDSYWGVSQ